MTTAFSDPSFVESVLAELACGRPVVLASLLSSRGSMPRGEGARLALLANGTLLGTVGGGNLEAMAIERCRAVAAGAPASLEWITRDKSGMACGGDALLAVRALGPGDAAVLDELARVLASGGRTGVEERWADPEHPTLEVVPFTGRGCTSWDADAATWHEVVCAPDTLHVFGAGHVGTALVPIAASVGFSVAVYDDRPEAADPARLPAATRVTCGSFVDMAEGADIRPWDSVVVLTHGHASDADVLKRVLTRETGYVGCIGSRNKTRFVHRMLAEAGIPQERIDDLHLPIGEAILAVTPAEIAVSIAAQLIRCRAERLGVTK